MAGHKKIKRTYFITGTDTGVGKTIATCVLGKALQKKGFDIGIMKPVQSSGNDAVFLKKSLNITDNIDLINPYYAPEPLSPHIAFPRQKIQVSFSRIISAFKVMQKLHDIMLIEGAGGLMAPLNEHSLIIDLIKSLEAEVIIVSRLGLGTINHTLLTIEQARLNGLDVAGIIFNSIQKNKVGIAEKTNPEAIKYYGNIEILGTIPFLKNFAEGKALEQVCKTLNIMPLVKDKNRLKRARHLQNWDKKYVWHPFTQMKDWTEEEPLVIDRADGNYLIDTEGNRYLDGVSSLWVNVHGHGKRPIDKAITTQLNKLDHSTLLGLANTPSIELAKALVGIAPKGLNKVFYSDSGSTAVEIAIKMAYQYWQNTGRSEKSELVHMANSYHGDTLGSVSVGGIDLFHKIYRGLVFKTRTLDFPDCYRAPEGKKYPEYAFEYVDRFEKIAEKEQDKMAALIVEPIVQGAAGMIMWPDGILRKLWEICKRYDIIFIADEVATGFGRTGKMFACEHEAVEPDILCMAKGITGGYLPLAATLTSQRIFDGFVFNYKEQKTFFHGHTYTGNPLACAAALANIQIFKNEKTLQKLQPKIKCLRQQLDKLKDMAHIGDIRQKGLMAGIELVKDKITKEPLDWEDKIGAKVCRRIRERGIILRPLGNVIVLMPPLSITKEEIMRLVDVLKWGIKEIL